MTPPKNYTELVNLFGNPSTADLSLNRQWEAKNIVSFELPKPLHLHYQGKQVKTIKVHALLTPPLGRLFIEIWNYARQQVKKGFPGLTTAEYDVLTQKWLDDRNLTQYGGAFTYRAMRGSDHLSMHSYGIAIDIDPEHNPLGSKKTTLPKWYINIWKKHGFFWGGDYRKRKDPMHFEYFRY